MIKTCEFVSPRHPDKLCDQIADRLLDGYLAVDPSARVAIEVMGGHGAINISGEVTAPEIDVFDAIRPLVGEMDLKINLVRQSPFIARGVDDGGAGDQGIMVGFACRDTENLMPREYELARDLCQKIYEEYPFDGKVQVTMDGEQVLAVVTSFQNSKTPELLKLLKSLAVARQYLVNPAGEWTMGGFEADSGLSGRKIVVDAYGPNVPVGGGSFSGKDASKVDRSGAYMARKIAVDILNAEQSVREATVWLSYAIGRPEPLMAVAEILDVDLRQRVIEVRGYDLTPKGIYRSLGFDRMIFSTTAEWGHFGRGFPWDK